MSNYNAFRGNIPMGGEKIHACQNTYYFEIHGEVAIAGYSEADAMKTFRDDIGGFLLEIYNKEDVDVLPEKSQQTYLFEVYGEIPIVGYSEEDAKNTFCENLRDYLTDAFHNGDIELLN